MLSVDGTITAVTGTVRSTVTVIDGLVVLLPAASNATARTWYVACGTVFEFHWRIQPHGVEVP